MVEALGLVGGVALFVCDDEGILLGFLFEVKNAEIVGWFLLSKCACFINWYKYSGGTCAFKNLRRYCHRSPAKIIRS